MIGHFGFDLSILNFVVTCELDVFEWRNLILMTI